LQEFDAKAPVLWVETSKNSPSMLMMVLALNKEENSNKDNSGLILSRWALIEFNLRKKKRGRVLLEHSKSPFTCASMQSYSDLSVEKDPNKFCDRDAVVIGAGDRVFAFSITLDKANSNSRHFFARKHTHLRDVTCVALHPCKEEFVTGDCMGQIHVWYGAAHSTNVEVSKLHWHSHAVKCVSYSSDGNFLTSGGEECVFVSWNLESGRRAFLPRRSAPISAIAARCDGAGYGILLADNSIFQYNHITKEEEWHFVGLSRVGLPATLTLPSKNLIVDPVTHAIPLNGVSTAGILQFYDPYKNRVLKSVILTERNQVTRTEDEIIPKVIAQHIAFSATGDNLVTIHMLHEGNTMNDYALRFWSKREDGTFYVNTAIDAPHGTMQVTSMSYSPTDDMLVTADASGEFKIWVKTLVMVKARPDSREAIPNGQLRVYSWSCRSVAQFQKKPVTAVAFSDDGSILAITYENLVTLWDPKTNAMRKVMSCGSSHPSNAVKQLCFTGASSPYLIARSDTEFQVWNLLSCEMAWSYKIPVESCVYVKKSILGSHVDEASILLTLSQGDEGYIFVAFNASSNIPMRIVHVENKDVYTAIIHPNNEDILFMDAQSNLWRVGEHKDINRKDDAYAEENALGAVFKHQYDTCPDRKQPDHVAASTRATANTSKGSMLFDAPAHVLPSMTALYRSFMDGMLPKASSSLDSSSKVSGSSKKKNKKRKKRSEVEVQVLNSAHTEATVVSSEDIVFSDAKMVEIVEKEMENIEFKKETYAKLVQAFTKASQSKSPSKSRESPSKKKQKK
jgi:NET1-associated nuclear protein 1 (U3 small nucleolar RNA-associated protein 17)